MTFNLKKALLAGSAIVAVGAMGSGVANAQVLVGNTNSGTAPAAVVSGAINMSTFNLTVNNTNNIAHGALTSTTGNLIIGDSAAGALTSTIGSYTSTGAGAVTITNAAANTGVLTVNVGGGLTTGTGGNLSVLSQSTAASDNTVLNVTGATVVGGVLSVTSTGTAVASTITNAANFAGALSVAGTTTLTGGNGAFANTAAITVGGNSTFTGAVTVTGGANAASPATLTLNGATNAFGGNLTLTNGAAGQARLVLSGASAQTVSGNISGTGAVRVDNAAGARFSGTVAAGAGVTIDNSTPANAASATFQNNVTGAVALGTNTGAGATTLNLDSTNNNITVAGAITGGVAEVTTMNVTNSNSSNARIVTLSTAATTGIDTLNVSGNTTLTTNQNLTADGITVGAGSTLANTASLITSNISLSNSGTIALNGTGGLTAANGITGTGFLDVNANNTVSGSITQGTADIAAASTLTHSGVTAYNVGSTNFSGAGAALALSGGTKTVTGNFTNTTDGQGTISIADVAGTTSFVGNLGASTANSLAALTVAGPTAQTVTTTGNLFVDAITFNAADTLQFLGNSAQTVSGTTNGGIITVGNGTTTSDVTFNGVGTGLASGTVALGSTARYNANSTYTGGYTNTGTTVVNQGATLNAASFNDAGAYSIGVVDADGIVGATDFGRITDASPGSTITNSRLNIVLTGDIGVGNAASVLTGTTVLTTGGVLTDNSIQYTFTANNAAGNTDIAVTKATAVSLAGAENAGVAKTLDGLSASTNAQISSVVDRLATAETQSAFADIVESVGPTQDGGAIVSGFTTSVQSMDVTNTRLASLRNGSETAMTAGEMGNGLTGWLQGFGQQATQDKRDGIDGYDADTYGVVVGLDTANMIQNGTVGVGFSYGNTDVESDNINATQSDVDSYQVSLYGDYDVTPETYVAGTLGFAHNTIDQTRSNVGGISGLTANADYDSQQYIAYAEVGHDYNVADRTTLTPKLLAHYQHITIDDYSETGAGGLNLNVDSDNLNILELGVGAELAWDLDGENGSKVRPALNAGYRHDVIGDSVSSTSSFTGGGASFNTNGLEPAHGTFNFGASLGYALTNNWEFTADYNYEVKSDYDAHNAALRASYKF